MHIQSLAVALTIFWNAASASPGETSLGETMVPAVQAGGVPGSNPFSPQESPPKQGDDASKPKGPPGKGSKGPGPGKSVGPERDQPPTDYGFKPKDALWSRLSIDKLPEMPSTTTALDLAPKLGLEPIGASALDGVERYRHTATGMEFVFIPAGTFPMGAGYAQTHRNSQVMESARRSKLNEDYFAWEMPQAQVYLSPYFIGVFEVTVAQYKQFLEAADRGEVKSHEFPLSPKNLRHIPYLWKEDVPFWSDNQPIVGISWLSAYAFSHWMGGRLPTEAEWEKAARGGDDRVFPWGDRFDPMRANTLEGLNRRTTPVGTYPGGRSPSGCYDMAGNASEFVLDAFEETAYRYRPLADPCLLERAPRKPTRVVRGGSWNPMGQLVKARTTARGKVEMLPHYSTGHDAADYLHYGFRVVLSPDQDLYPPDFLEQERKRSEEEREMLIQSPIYRVNDKNDAAETDGGKDGDGEDGGAKDDDGDGGKDL